MSYKSIKWDITTKCNLHCTHCSVGKEYFTKGANEICLSPKLEIIDKLAEGGVGAISLLGGEPLTMGKDLLAFIQHAVNKSIKISLVTNGLLLEGTFMEQLVSSGIERIVISMEGASKDTHDPIRGKGTFEKLTNNIINLKEYITRTNSPLLIGINTVISQKNINEIEQMFDLLTQLGVNEWTILSLGDVGFAKDNINELAIPPQEEINIAIRLAKKVHSEKQSKLSINSQFTYPLVWDYVEKKYGLKMDKPRICCSASISLGFVSPDGHLYPCDRIAKEYYVGYKIDGIEIKPMNLLDHTFYEIWNSEYFVKMFNFILDKSTYTNYEPCTRCEYFHKKYCTPCPLYSLTSKVVISSCSIVEKEMGTELKQIRQDYQVEELLGFEKAKKNINREKEEKEINQIINCVPKKKAGIRSFENGESLLLLNPVNIDYSSLNIVGKAIWDLIDGQKTVGQISQEITATIGIALKKIPLKEQQEKEINENLNRKIATFIEELKSLDVITLYPQTQST